MRAGLQAGADPRCVDTSNEPHADQPAGPAEAKARPAETGPALAVPFYSAGIRESAPLDRAAPGSAVTASTIRGTNLRSASSLPISNDARSALPSRARMESRSAGFTALSSRRQRARWPAAGLVDTEIRFSNRIGGFHAATSVQPRVQA